MDDIFRACVEEIALEGLEGSNLPTLWANLKNAVDNIVLDENVCASLMMPCPTVVLFCARFPAFVHGRT